MARTVPLTALGAPGRLSESVFGIGETGAASLPVATREVEAMKVLVIGGGIGGLSTTLALRRQGFEVDVVERDPEWGCMG